MAIFGGANQRRKEAMEVGFVLSGGAGRIRERTGGSHRRVSGRGVPSMAKGRTALHRTLRMEMKSSEDTKENLVASEERTTAIIGGDQGGEPGTISTVEDPDMTGDETSGENATSDAYADLLYCLAIFATVPIIFGLLTTETLESHGKTVLTVLFAVGYSFIVFEEQLKLNKSAVSMIMAAFMWTITGGSFGVDSILGAITEKLGDVSEILFFLLGAMTIVEIVDAHEGFKIVTDYITTNSRKALLWIVGFVTFFMSSILDNLTSTIVMVSLLRKLVKDPEERRLLGGVVVIAANAGGAWTVIGDVTTTMLWIDGNISAIETMKDLFAPSLASLVVSLAILTPGMKGEMTRPERPPTKDSEDPNIETKRQIVFWGGVGALVGVPIFKAATGLPPFMGMIAGLGTIWVVTDYINRDENKSSDYRRASSALQRIDTSSVLFFLGILLSVGALENVGLLRTFAEGLDYYLPNLDLVAVAIGIFSAIIDNVPLVAATMGMYDATQFPIDSKLWQLIAYCAGTGGSIFVIGSAAGVALMGMEKVDFFWYAKKISLSAAAGFFAGVGVYLATHSDVVPQVVSWLPGV